MKKIKVILSPEAKEVYEFLNRESQNSKFEKTILNALHNKIEHIKNNIHYGQPIAKKLIPQEYFVKYGITNLFRVELPNYWRMLYTLSNGESEIEIIAFVLDLVDHKIYDKKIRLQKELIFSKYACAGTTNIRANHQNQRGAHPVHPVHPVEKHHHLHKQPALSKIHTKERTRQKPSKSHRGHGVAMRGIGYDNKIYP